MKKNKNELIISTPDRSSGNCRNEKAPVLFTCLFCFLLLSLISFGTLLSLLSITFLPMPTTGLYVLILVLCAWYVGISHSEKIGDFLFLLSYLLISILFFIKRELFFNGLFTLINHIIRQINNYYSMNLNMYIVTESDTATLYFLGISMAILIGFLSRAVCPRPQVSILLLETAPVLILGLTLGNLPFQAAVMMLILSYLMASCFNQAPDLILNIRIALCTGIGVLMLYLISSAFLSPIISPNLYRHSDSLLNGVRQLAVKLESSKLLPGKLFSFLSTSGTIEDGTLSNQTPNYMGIETLQITMDQLPNQTTYLKGFVGSDYSFSKWEPISQDNFQKASAAWANSSSPEQDLSNMPYQIFQKIEQKFHIPPLRNTLLKYTHTNMEYSYFPYGSKIPDYYLGSADGPAKGDGGKQIWVQGYPLEEYKNIIDTLPSLPEVSDSLLSVPLSSGADISNPAIFLSEENAVLEENYYNYVQEEYLKLPDSGFPLLRELCRNQHLESTTAITDYIVQFLGTQASYNLHPAPLNSGEDFLDQFLFTEKQGYCIHFATAAALMFRLMGVPARYVSGYAVPADQFKSMANNEYRASVKDYHAHAWVEIYTRQIGWVPIEATPPSAVSQEERTEENNAASNPISPDTKDASKETKTGPESNDSIAPSEEEDADSSNVSAKKEAQSSSLIVHGLIFIIKLLILLFILLFLLILRRYFVITKRMGLLNQKNYNQAISQICFSLTEMLHLAGYRQAHNISDQIYAQNIQSQLPGLKNQELIELIQLAQKASFHQTICTRQEARYCRRHYRVIRKQLYKDLTVLQRFIWVFLKCY